MKSVNVPIKKCAITFQWITISCLIWVSFLQQVSVIDICSLKRHLNQISHVNQIKLLSFAIPRRIDVGINVLEFRRKKDSSVRNTEYYAYIVKL